MKHLLKTALLFLFAFQAKSQYLYLQENYKGGISLDGKGYLGFDAYLPDTIAFKNIVSIGSTLKKAFLITQHHLVFPNPPSDNPINLLFNNIPITIDSTNLITSYYCRQVKLDLAVKDVTPYALFANNKLITPHQTDHYGYDGFLLVLLYANNSMSPANVAVFFNNTQTINNPISLSFTNLNPINTANDVDLSIWVDDVTSEADSVGFTLISSLNSFHIGDLYPSAYSIPNNDNTNLPGSFYYQNNTLFGLSDDVNSPLMDSTDAICNIKKYVANNTKNFVLTTNNAFDCVTNAFIMAYSSPCAAIAISTDTTKQYATCTGQGVQISASAGYSNYSWVPATGLSNSAVAAPIATPPTGANKYICYVADAQGCMHTEHFTVNSYATPIISSSSTPEICGGTKGVAVINAGGTNFGSYTYTYTVNGIAQSGNIYDLPAGVYSYSVANNFGCNVQGTQSFTVTEVNNAQAAFTAQPDTGCAPENIVFTNNSTNTNAQVWYINGDSTNAINPNYTFTDSGLYTITLLSWYNQRQCSSIVTHTVSLKDCPPPPPVPADSISIVVPNIFTPNADGVNDSWQVEIYTRGYTISNFQCNIYDRWGIQVFDSNTSPSGRTGGVVWSGKTSGGESASAGSYFYLIKLTQTNSKGVSENKEFKGYLELIR
jgi:gliding motility-associated-like protein